MKYVIVPGLGNSGAKHWQTYFEKNLASVIRIQQENWNEPNKVAWVETLKETLGKIKDDYIIIAHSLGCLTALHYLKNERPRKLKGLFLVAPADTENTNSKYDLSSFNPIPSNKVNYKTLVIGSNNDPWINVKRIVNFAENWQAELLLLDNARHINANSGHGQWEEGLKILDTFFYSNN